MTVSDSGCSAESGVLPVLGDVVGFPFGCDIVILNQLFGEGDHPQRLSETSSPC